MTGEEPWAVVTIDEAGKNTPEVTEAYVHGDPDTALDGTADIVAVPGDTLGHVGVDAGGDDEAGEVFDMIVL